MVSVGAEWINLFPAPCTQNTLSYCDETSEGFLNGMTSRGHTQAFDWGNGNAWEQDFRDVSFSGDDRNWADNVDFVHFSAHGGTNSSNVFRGYFGTAGRGLHVAVRSGPLRRQLEPRVPVHRCLQQPRAQPQRDRDVAEHVPGAAPDLRLHRRRVGRCGGPPGAATGSGAGPATTRSCRTPGSTSATRSGATTTPSRWPRGGRRPTPRTGSTTSASSRGSVTSRTTRSRGSAGNGGAEPAPDRPIDDPGGPTCRSNSVNSCPNAFPIRSSSIGWRSRPRSPSRPSSWPASHRTWA